MSSLVCLFDEGEPSQGAGWDVCSMWCAHRQIQANLFSSGQAGQGMYVGRSDQ